MYLLDTNVVSESRKPYKAHAGAVKIHPHVQTWIASTAPSSLYLSVITILELEVGVLLLERRDPKQSAILRSWMRDQVLPAFAGRILSVDITIALRCAAMHVPNPQEDRDALIAATALVNGMTVVTRNTSHFRSTGVNLINPWEPQPFR